MTAFLTITTGLFILLLPDSAWAWGFGVHLQLGNRLLENLSLLSPALQHLLTYYSADFLYGSISADITLGKKYTHYLKHCHSWNMGFKVLDAAENDAQRACAYGYLAHLAADTVAHSYMVPFKMIRSYNTVLLNHAYWELRFESQIPAQIWQEARLRLARFQTTRPTVSPGSGEYVVFVRHQQAVVQLHATHQSHSALAKIVANR